METYRTQGLITALFNAWRRLLTLIARRMVDGWDRVPGIIGRPIAAWAAVRAYISDPGSVWRDGSDDRITPAVAFGLRAFIAGLLISIGVALGSGTFLSTALLGILIELLWAAARLTIVMVLLPTHVRRTHVLLAFAAGLAPYAIGVTPLLRFASLGLSAVLTERGLRGAGAEPGQARVATVWAFGGQAAIMIAGVVVRSVVASIAGI